MKTSCSKITPGKYMDQVQLGLLISNAAYAIVLCYDTKNMPLYWKFTPSHITSIRVEVDQLANQVFVQSHCVLQSIPPVDVHGPTRLGGRPESCAGDFLIICRGLLPPLELFIPSLFFVVELDLTHHSCIVGLALSFHTHSVSHCLFN